MNAKVGIVFHTTYRTAGQEDLTDLTAEFGADVNQWSKHKDVWAVNADFNDVSGTATFTEADAKKITSMLSQLGKDFNKVNGRFLDSIRDDKVLKVHIKTFINSKVRTGDFIDENSAREAIKFIKRINEIQEPNEDVFFDAWHLSINGHRQYAKYVEQYDWGI